MRTLFMLALCLPWCASAQQLTPQHLSDLAAPLDEISGMLVLDGQVWGVPDSFNPAMLYCADPRSGAITRTVAITNAHNVDWEALTMDAHHVYVGDIGNNYGVRHDLKVLRFPLAALRDPTITEVEAEVIAYTYADQSAFVPVRDGTNWDCEALLVVGDSLWLFTKNWVDQRSYRYVLPATPGTWQAQRRDTLAVDGLITDAALHPERGSLVLLGHTMAMEPILWHLAAFPAERPFAGNMLRYTLNMPAAQTESVAWTVGDTLWIGQERGGEVPAKLWRAVVDPALGHERISAEDALRLYPMPATDHVFVHHGRPWAQVRVFDVAGKLLLMRGLSDGERLDLSALSVGTHIIEVRGGMEPVRRRILVQH